ncbi:MAG: lactate utilization protein [Anaerolinea sp.]|nr:lactate utilization protein [Anaerolinea sp.]
MTARDDILHRLCQQKREIEQPGAWSSRQRFVDLAGQFMAALTAVHGEPHLTPTLEDAASKLGQILTDLNAARVVINDEAPLADLHLPERWPHIAWHTVGQSEGDLRDFCIHADVGLSSSAAAIAATGSVLIHSGPGQSRVATLFPPVHIVLLPTSRLTADLFTFTASRNGSPPTAGRPPAAMTLISGPSKTADIEQTMAIGVHGPKRFIVILYGAT